MTAPINVARVALLMIVFTTCCSVMAGTPQGVTPPGGPGDSQQVEDLNWLKDSAIDAHRGFDRLQAMKQSPKFIEDANLACDLKDARVAADGRAYIKGKATGVEAYEVSCGNGLGYILASQDKHVPSIISCFSIASQTQGAPSKSNGRAKRLAPFACRLPANIDTNSMAFTLLKGLSANCDVTGVSSFGVDSNTKIEYVEAACADRTGYVLAIPQTVSGSQLSVMSCQDAARHSLKCHLTEVATTPSGPPPVTMQTLYDALKQNGINCGSGQAQLRLIGRESIKRRYVVEAQCPDRPDGLVAYIPLQDITNTFEAIDCKEAAKRQITCQLNHK